MTWQRARGLTICCSIVVLAACPFASQVPLGAPQASAVDPRVVGRWTWQDPKDPKATTEFLVVPFNDAEYLIETKEGDKEPDRYRAYVVDVGGKAFLNINEIGKPESAKSFSFARYEALPDRLTLRFVGDGIVPKRLEADANGLRDFLQAHLNEPALDDTDGAFVLRRPRRAPWAPLLHRGPVCSIRAP